jgi:hypothetical protein
VACTGERRAEAPRCRGGFPRPGGAANDDQNGDEDGIDGECYPSARDKPVPQTHGPWPSTARSFLFALGASSRSHSTVGMGHGDEQSSPGLTSFDEIATAAPAPEGALRSRTSWTICKHWRARKALFPGPFSVAPGRIRTSDPRLRRPTWQLAANPLSKPNPAPGLRLRPSRR